MTSFELSVVIATDTDDGQAVRTIRDAVAACGGVSAEVLLVHAGALPAELPPTMEGVAVRSIELPAGTLAPVLWGAGARAARGTVLAFTTTQMRLTPGWGRALHRAIVGRMVGAAGVIGLAAGADPATAATFFVRFSAFVPQSVAGASESRSDIPGDNAAYSSAQVHRHADLLREGFWEVEFHRRFAQEGLRLELLHGAPATMVGPVRFATVVRQRFAHAAEFGISRVRRHGESPLLLMLAAPLVPAVLVARTARRVLRWAPYRRPFLTALPWLAVLASAWALGEAWGALRAASGATSGATSGGAEATP